MAYSTTVAQRDWTILNNTRCVNDVGQFHDMSSYLDCESICISNLSVPLFSFCSVTEAPTCPTPTATCWCYPLSDLSQCSSSAGWISGYTQLPPPLPPPSDWVPAINSGNMAFTADSPEEIGIGYYPVVGNGFIAFETGPFTQVFENTWPWRDAGSLQMNGVFSGKNFVDPSHHAQIPKFSDVTILAPSGSNITNLGCAIDFSTGVYYNRSLVYGVPGCEDGTIVEQRTYAHRSLREFFVFEIRAFSLINPSSWSGCTVPVSWSISPNIAALNDTVLEQSISSQTAVWKGTTMVSEEIGLPLRKLALVFDSWPIQGGLPVTELVFTPSADILSVRVVLRSDLDVLGATSPDDVATAALATWNEYVAFGSDLLLQSHMDAWSSLWASGGVELSGNSSFAATVNASLYDILSSLRSDWNYSTSPGGLGTSGYGNHCFWDMETWMFPLLTVLYPDLARVAAQYRIDRLSASLTNAINMGYEGAMWSWESAFTGLWTAPWREADFSENHISADIPLALRKFYYMSGDKEWLTSVWPILNETCRFWACRFTRIDSTGPSGPPGYAVNCSAKDGSGNWTVKGVIPPDESSGVSNDEVYTNAAGALTLSWCLEAAEDLGIPLATLPQLWSTIASSPYLPLSNSLYSQGLVHVQQTGYNGHTINQADVALLQFPLGLDFGEEQNQRDLDYYASKTDFSGMFLSFPHLPSDLFNTSILPLTTPVSLLSIINQFSSTITLPSLGMFTGDSAYSVSYLALGNRSAADAQLQLAFNHIEPHFLVFHETAFDDGHTQHFITGAGGYLQSFVFGFSGMRIDRVGVLTFSSKQPILPPLGVTRAKLRGVHLLTSSFDVDWTDQEVCLSLRLNGAAIELRLPSQPSTPITSTAICISSQSFEVAGIGYI